ncbi:hypothetical protein P4H66_00645 [Paenibacillus dokdonensis]|uniref:AAA+ ATPase domain-containing protein n=1 Tax=Paenibacillus dokdonensis TaxID=2567944 RepID=A0ABU6GG44_9BACL|nr:hypothetical protein [Paenibacillus dokdonensis]MEC0238379.1 hypothetical protein [Paenibacillus dokdonensis]
MTFKTSVNIKFDIGNIDFIKRYIPTPSHAEAMKGIIEGFTDENPSHSHIIVGPYGTGKSLLANVVGTIAAKMADVNEISNLVSRFDHVDDHIGKKIKNVSELSTSYLPILLSGNEGRFRQSVLSSVINKLKEDGIEVVLPGVSAKIIDTIQVWKTKYPDTFEAFIRLLEKDEKKVDKWIVEIQKQNEVEMKYFSKIYPMLTAGASFDVDYDHSFISQMEYLISIFQENNFGIFIVYDEFTRFLQGLSRTKFNEAMQDIQDLAELSNRSNYVHLLLITHKSLRHYFNADDEEFSKEFQRIEKRFRQYLIKSDQATFLRIAEIIISENIERKPLIKPETFSRIQGLMRKYPLFPSINQTERDELVIRGMYPLHPVALFLLPNLTRVFGQNERTLFTFLESQETGCLINHISKSDAYYLPHQLFDFFFPDSNEYINEEIAEHILLFKKAIARIPGDLVNKKSALSLVKLITLWNLCAVQSEQKLTTEFLSFATQIDEEDLSELLATLSENKIARFNRINQFWELFSGNSIDLHEKIELEKQLIKIDSSIERNVLQSNLSKKYFLPEQYNDEKGMTRFAAIKFLYEKDALQGKLGEEDKFSDISIYYVLPSLNSKTELLEEKLEEMSRQEDILFFLHYKPVDSIKLEISNLLVLESLKKNRALLAEDIGIKEELDILVTETKHAISQYLSEISNYEIDHSWFVNGSKVNIASELEIASILTEKCNRLYDHTPVILNDSFNRSYISGVQRNAAIKLIDQILTSAQDDSFGIIGNGPEYALFASIFKNNDRFDLNVNNFDYVNIQNEHLALLRERLIETLENNHSGNFQDIVNLFVSPPFGIRKPLVPILLVALLRDRWNEFMLYRNDMFVPGINGTKLFEIIVEVGAENYQYKYESIDQNHIEFFNEIELQFQEAIEDRLNNDSRLIYTAGTLLKWLRSLPRITQTSDKVDDQFKQLRDLIKRSEIHPQQSIAHIYEIFHTKFDKLLFLKYYGESHIARVNEELFEIVMRIINVESYSELREWVIQQQEQFGRNKLVETLHSSIYDADSHAWLQQFAGSYIGIDIDEWSDATFDLFISQMNYDYQSIGTYGIEETQSKEDVVTVQLDNSKKIINKVDLSVKSTTIYKNLERMINNAGKNVPRQEIEYLVYTLFENYVVKSE